MTDTYWKPPPVAGTEAEHLIAALERQRATFRYKTDGLDAAGLDARFGASALTIGGLLKHLARAEDQMFGPKLSGVPMSEPWRSAPWEQEEDWDFTSAADDTPEDLYAIWDETIARSRIRLSEAMVDGGLDAPVHQTWYDDQHLNLRHLLCDLLEEYGRHTGHADLLRENIDGRVGEDPPWDWWPQSGPAATRPSA